MRTRNLNYPENIIEDIFGTTQITSMLKDTIEERIELTFKEYDKKFSEAEKEILKLYYKDSKTVREIANIYNFSHARAAKIRATALKKLKVFGRKNIIDYYTLKDEIESVKNNVDILFEKDISELGITSTQTYNALRKEGINTIGDLCNYSRNDIRSILRVGKKGEERINAALSYFFEKYYATDILIKLNRDDAIKNDIKELMNKYNFSSVDELTNFINSTASIK